VISQHVGKRPFTVRFAQPSDLEALFRLEDLAWAPNLRAGPDVLRRRLETTPTTNYVCEMNGKVVAVLYTQRIASIDAVNTQKFQEISAAHDPNGPVVQLIAIATDPDVSQLGIGSELRAFALHLARLDLSVETVVAVTLCRDYKSYGGSLKEYIDDHIQGDIVDPIVNFHTSYGAQVVGLVPDFRPEDQDNEGTGVLIQYQIRDLLAAKTETRIVKQQKATPQADAAGVRTLELISGIMEDLGYPLDYNDLYRGFFNYGMDSLDLVRIRNRLASALSMELPSTLLLDYPTAKDLADHMDKERGPLAPPAGGKQAESELPGPEQAEPKVGWDAITATELLSILDKCKKIYALPQYQRRFSDLARRSYPDMIKYILMIEEVLVEVEGPIMLDMGLIEDMDKPTVQKSRGEMVNAIMKYWLQVPDLRNRHTEITHLTKQDQYWS